MTVPLLHRLCVLLAASVPLAACKSPKSNATQQGQPASSTATSASSAAAPERAAWGKELQPDPGFQAELARVASRCSFLEQKDITSCAGSDLDALKAKVHELGPPALETLLAAISGAAPPERRVAAMQMRGIYERSLGPFLAKAPIPPRVVSALIAATQQLPLADAIRVAPAATFVATREGRLQELMQVVEPRPELRTTILPRVMRYGRMQAFEEVQKWAGSTDEATVLAALEALRLMDDWTSDERARLGPWLEGFLDAQSNKVQGKAASFLLFCDDERVEKALGWFDAALRGKRLTRDTIFAYGGRCHPGDYAGLKPEQQAELAASPLCAKIEKKLDRVAADEGSDGGLREAALESLTATWPNTARRRAKTLTKHSDYHLAQIALNVLTLVGDDTPKAK